MQVLTGLCHVGHWYYSTCKISSIQRYFYIGHSNSGVSWLEFVYWSSSLCSPHFLYLSIPFCLFPLSLFHWLHLFLPVFPKIQCKLPTIPSELKVDLVSLAFACTLMNRLKVYKLNAEHTGFFWVEIASEDENIFLERGWVV